MSQPVDPALSADMTVLEVLQHRRDLEAVFKSLETETGHCICCEALFDPLTEVARRYGLDLTLLLDRLKKAAAAPRPEDDPDNPA